MRKRAVGAASSVRLFQLRKTRSGRSLTCILLGMALAVLLPTQAPRAVDPMSEGLLAPPIGGPDAATVPDLVLSAGGIVPVAPAAVPATVEVVRPSPPSEAQRAPSPRSKRPSSTTSQNPEPARPSGDLGVLLITCYSFTSRTASGTQPTEGIAAADPGFLPLGTVISIEGLGTYTVADTGPLGRKIDVWMRSEADCIAFGKQRRRVTVVSRP